MSNNWQQLLQTAIRDTQVLSEFLGISLPATSYPTLIPLPLAKRIRDAGNDSPLWQQFVPSSRELQGGLGLNDPIGDTKYLRAPQLIHRYPSKVLFMPTHQCPVLCRFCFRKNELYPNFEIFQSDFEQTLHYLKQNTGINEIIFSGGDPLILSDQKIDFYLNAFSEIPHLKYIRFHTRVPVIIPERITSSFTDLLNHHAKQFHLTTVIHTNCSEEWGQESSQAALMLPGIKLSQTVLLKNINHQFEKLIDLFQYLISLNIRPYYLHLTDPVQGGLHFMVNELEARKIHHQLRNHLPGHLVPRLVRDNDSGEFKEILG